MLDGPSEDRRPLVWSVEDCRSWNADKYERYLVKVISDLQAKCPHVLIGGIVHDRLAAQEKAVAAIVGGMFRDLAIIDVPCYNHMTNLVFIDGYRDSDTLRLMVENVLCWQRVLRTAQARESMGKVCPNVPRTRWYYIVDLLHFILTNRSMIETFLLKNIDQVSEQLAMNDDVVLITDIPRDFEILMLILKPLHDLSLILEHQGTTLPYIIPLCEMIIKKWARDANDYKSILTEEHREALRIVIINFLARLFANAYDEATAAFLLSYRGIERPFGDDETQTTGDVSGFVHDCQTDIDAHSGTVSQEKEMGQEDMRDDICDV